MNLLSEEGGPRDLLYKIPGICFLCGSCESESVDDKFSKVPTDHENNDGGNDRNIFEDACHPGTENHICLIPINKINMITMNMKIKIKI